MSIGTTTAKTYKAVLKEFKASVKARVDQALIDSGYVDEEGEVDKSALHEAVYEAIMSRPLKNKKGKSDPAQSMTKGELYEETITDGPSADPADWDEDGIDEEAIKDLSRLVWDLTQTKPRGGKIQRRLDAEGSSMVLCRGPVFRGSDIVRDGVYVTDDKATILEDALNAPLVLLEKAAEAAREYVEMIEDRHDELTPEVRAQIADTLGRVHAALPTGNGKVSGDAS
jgi:hypothetical protein